MGILTSCFVTFTVAMLFLSMLGGIYGHGRKRIFLGGFAIGAWGFLALAYGVFNLEDFGSRMLTTEALKYIRNSCLGENPSYQYYTDPLNDAREQVDYIGHCVFTLTSGLLCALAARLFARDASLHEHAARPRFKVSTESILKREFAISSGEKR
jgi:hypothetical protein